MLISLPGRPEEYFEELGEMHDYLASVDKRGGRILAVYAVQINGTQVVLHMEPLVALTPTVIKEYMRDFKRFKDEAARNGMTEIAAVNAKEPNNEAWWKFVQRMGFPKPILMATTVLPIQHPAVAGCTDDPEDAAGENGAAEEATDA